MTRRDRERRHGSDRAPGGGAAEAALQQYSRRVRLLKVLLPVAALIVVGAIFLAGRDRGDGSRLLSAEEIARLSAGLRLETPRFTGRTAAGEPFVIRADWAEPDGAMPEEIALARPTGRIELADGRTVEGRARRGLLDRGSDTLALSGAVEIETSDGYRFESETLEIDTARQEAESPGPVVGTGPAGRIEAGAMRLSRPEGKGGDAQIWFEKRVRVVFIPANGARAGSAARPPGGGNGG
jgi:lipopolysaccharide export system protein LptC